MSKKFLLISSYYLFFLVIVFCSYFSLLHFFKNDIFYDTDIARDFLLWQEMSDKHKLTLIGGRSSLPGLFHGPLYYWLGWPFFLLAGGNPLGVAVFWAGSYALFIGSFFYLVKKFFSPLLSLAATALLMTLTWTIPAGFTHTTLANFLFLPFVAALSLYFYHQQGKFLGLAILLEGAILQLQMAFGVPMLLVLGSYTLFAIIKNKRYAHLWWGFLLLLPLSTYLLFDCRHHWMQLQAVGAYLAAQTGESFPADYLQARLVAILDCFGLIKGSFVWQVKAWAVIAVIGAGTIWRLWRQKTKKITPAQLLLNLCLLSVIGFWLVTAFYKTNIWPLYYRALLPGLVLLVTTAIFTLLPKKWAMLLITLVVLNNFRDVFATASSYARASATTDEVHWQFYRQMVSDINKDSAGESYGYYIFTPDQYGYQAKYALQYFGKNSPVLSFPYQKRHLTYLLIAPHQEDDAGGNPLLDVTSWRRDRVNINRTADSSWFYADNHQLSYTVEKFFLNDDELAQQSDPDLIVGLECR